MKVKSGGLPAYRAFARIALQSVHPVAVPQRACRYVADYRTMSPRACRPRSRIDLVNTRGKSLTVEQAFRRFCAQPSAMLGGRGGDVRLLARRPVDGFRMKQPAVAYQQRATHYIVAADDHGGAMRGRPRRRSPSLQPCAVARRLLVAECALRLGHVQHVATYQRAAAGAANVRQVMLRRLATRERPDRPHSGRTRLAIAPMSPWLLNRGFQRSLRHSWASCLPRCRSRRFARSLGVGFELN